MEVTRRQFTITSIATLGAAATLNNAWAEPALRDLPTEKQIRAKDPNLWKLVDLINGHRATLSLPRIAFSPSMSAVAALHAKDLFENQPHEKFGSLHSWSKDPRWTGGEYDAATKSTWPIMWDKPKEITGYAGYGFEVCAARVRDPFEALEVWKKSRDHYDVIVNRGTWSDPRWNWKAIGAVFHKGYACAWFGDRQEAQK